MGNTQSETKIEIEKKKDSLITAMEENQPEEIVKPLIENANLTRLYDNMPYSYYALKYNYSIDIVKQSIDTRSIRGIVYMALKNRYPAEFIKYLLERDEGIKKSCIYVDYFYMKGTCLQMSIENNYPEEIIKMFLNKQSLLMSTKYTNKDNKIKYSSKYEDSIYHLAKEEGYSKELLLELRTSPEQRENFEVNFWIVTCPKNE